MLKIKKNYHWIIFFVLLLEQVIYGGLLNNLNGLFLIPVCETLKIKRFLFSVAISLRTIGAIISTLFSGILKKYISNKRLMAWAMFIISMSCVFLGMSKNVVSLGLCFALMGLCDGFCYTAAVTRILASWFYSHQGILLGAVTAGSGMGGSLVCYILTDVMDKFDWRVGFYTCALLTLLLALIIQVALYDSPEKMKLTPFGLEKKTYKHVHKERHWDGYEKEVLVRKPAFYLFLVVIFLVTLCAQMGLGLVIPYFQDKLFSSGQTALLQSVLMIVLALSKLSAGLACDAVGARKVMLFCVLSIGSGILLMISAQELTTAIFAMVLLGCGLPVMTVLIPLLVYEVFGYQSADSLLGVYLSMASVSGLLSGYIANGVFDKTGSYNGVLLSAIVMLFITLFMLMIVFRLSANMKRIFERNRSVD